MVKKGDFRGLPPRLKKKRFDHTEKARKRREIKKKQTKAILRKKLRHAFAEAVFHLRTFNRVKAVDAKYFHLKKALIHLDACLEARPGNHMLKAQRTLCQEELWDIETHEESSKDRTIEIVLDPDWHG